jgi:AraC-like DNA-binding protein
MSGFTTSIYATAFVLCLFSAGVLSGRRTGAGRPLFFFTVYLFSEAIVFVLEVLMLHSAAPLKSLWLALRMSMSLVVAPLLWLAMREVVEGERPRLRAMSRWHFVTVAIGVVLTLPLLATAHWGTTYSNPARPPSGQPNLVHTTMVLCLLIFTVQVPWYLWRCRRILLGQVRAAENRGQRGNAEAWLHLPLIVVLCAWVIGVLRSLLGVFSATREEHVVLFAVAQVSVTVIAVYLIVRRAATMEREAEVELEPAPASFPAAVPEKPAEPYARTNLDDATRARIRSKIERAMADEAVYTNSLISLRSVAGAIKEKSHYVSQVINQDLGTTFYELVNRRRIERAKALLLTAPGQTVLEVALAVGFNSKSTFNAAFRRHTGLTPTEFRTGQRKDVTS